MGRNRTRHDRPRSYGRSFPNFRHDNGAGTNPTIGPNGNDFEYAVFGSFNTPALATSVLATAAQDLDTRGNLRPVSNIGPSKDAQRANEDLMPHRGTRISEKGSNCNVAFEGAATQCHGVVCYTKIAAGKARNQRKGLREKRKSAFKTAKRSKDSPREGQDQGHSLANALDDLPEYAAHISFYSIGNKRKDLLCGPAKPGIDIQQLRHARLRRVGVQNPLSGLLD